MSSDRTKFKLETDLDLREILGEPLPEGMASNGDYEMKAILIYDGDRVNGHYYGIFRR